MVTEGWANESDGSVDSPMGAFARVSVSEAEVGEVVDAFKDVLAMYPLDSLTQLIGNWLVEEDSQGNVSVTPWGDPINLTREFQRMQDEYALWVEGE